jgi:hypothetical protein
MICALKRNASSEERRVKKMSVELVALVPSI